MGLLELVQRHVEMRKVGSEWHGPCPACGHGPKGAAFSDRFTVKVDDRWFCRNCGNGDTVSFFRRFENMNCPDAHAAAGKVCTSTTCHVSDKCRMGNGVAPPKKNIAATPDLGAAKRPSAPFTPGTANAPADIWQAKAEEVVEAAHQALLMLPEQLDYLASRGLPLEAVVRYRLGWNAKTIWKSRESWGLPEKISEKTGKPKKLWVPRGIVIPTYTDGAVHRVRVRVPVEDRNETVPAYVAVSGSGDDVVVLNPSVRAFVVVEADLCALLVDWLVGDLVGAIPLVSCDVKPKSTAAVLLEKALGILVATDFDPRANTMSGNYENPGGKAARWWLKNYSRSKRWPVPVGKDPGDALAAGVDIRAWILAGLPPIFQVPGRKQEETNMSFDSNRAHQLLNDTQGRIGAGFKSEAWQWLQSNRPKVIQFIKAKEACIEALFEQENEQGIVRELQVLETAYKKAWAIYDERPPVLARCKMEGGDCVCCGDCRDPEE